MHETERIAPFEVGDRVTNALGWNGIVVKVETFEPCDPSQDGYYWRVHWWEREHHDDKSIRKQPVLGHSTEQLTLVRLDDE